MNVITAPEAGGPTRAGTTPGVGSKSMPKPLAALRAHQSAVEGPARRQGHAACPDIPAMLDGGVRRGSDVLKALALGARLVFVGRPFAYAAAIGGEAGVAHAINLLATEVLRDMAMLGVNSLDEINCGRHLVAEPPMHEEPVPA